MPPGRLDAHWTHTRFGDRLLHRDRPALARPLEQAHVVAPGGLRRGVPHGGRDTTTSVGQNRHRRTASPLEESLGGECQGAPERHGAAESDSPNGDHRPIHRGRRDRTGRNLSYAEVVHSK